MRPLHTPAPSGPSALTGGSSNLGGINSGIAAPVDGVAAAVRLLPNEFQNPALSLLLALPRVPIAKMLTNILLAV